MVNKIIIAMGIILVFVLLINPANANNVNYYPMTTVVCEVDYESDTVICSDFNENLWCFYGTEDWQTGDICSMIMSDNGTSNIKDDKIIMVKYDGWLGEGGW